jgi:hypothetical protein
LRFLPDTKVVYRRYASLFFIAGCASTDNELITLEVVHRYVEQMDKYYGNVCELDIIFNFQKAYFILDELLLAGEMQESSKKNVLRCISQQDSLEDMEVSRCISYLCRVYEMFVDLSICIGNLDATAVLNDLSDQTSIGLIVSPCCSSTAFYYPLETAPAPELMKSLPFTETRFTSPTFTVYDCIPELHIDTPRFLYDANVSSPQVEEDVVTKIM